MKEVSEADMLEALRVAHEAIKIQCKAQMEFTEEVGKTIKREYSHEENNEDLRKKVWMRHMINAIRQQGLEQMINIKRRGFRSGDQ